MVMVVSGTTAPEVSFTTPRMVPALCCAEPGMAINMQTHRTTAPHNIRSFAATVRLLRMESPSRRPLLHRPSRSGIAARRFLECAYGIPGNSDLGEFPVPQLFYF